MLFQDNWGWYDSMVHMSQLIIVRNSNFLYVLVLGGIHQITVQEFSCLEY